MNRTLRIWKAADAAEQEVIDAAEIQSAEERAATASRYKQNQAKAAAKQQQVHCYHFSCLCCLFANAFNRKKSSE
jgi:hypothetical protein